MADPAQLEPAPKKSNTVLIVILVVVGVMLLMLLLCVGVVLLIAIPAMSKAKVAAQEIGVVVQLKEVATAQARYEVEHAWFADSAKLLETEGMLFDRSLAAAFEAHNGNADGPGVPQNGYLYRMLQGEGANAFSWVSGTDPAAGRKLSAWGATAYPVEPGSTGLNQYYIGEAGVIYKTAMPAANTPPPLDAAPDLNQNTTWQVAR